MNIGVKLGVFGIGLVVIFAAALWVGSAVGPTLADGAFDDYTATDHQPDQRAEPTGAAKGLLHPAGEITVHPEFPSGDHNRPFLAFQPNGDGHTAAWPISLDQGPDTAGSDVAGVGHHTVIDTSARTGARQ
ncbi:hypothetical protein RIF23_11290 [Lipingzhangella sp. LS1_29]|uniref:Uncharacterized protein n=1 Tax=Lipingzhangella rawalii TaxID=2055835 RepID=A0ABU2H6G3_9ACTN|nr:hypothetical protein [Lipingzhangella rawalii]MDS1270886.1 hypothetical protein [Lipingzhangella rawalii]